MRWSFAELVAQVVNSKRGLLALPCTIGWQERRAAHLRLSVSDWSRQAHSLLHDTCRTAHRITKAIMLQIKHLPQRSRRRRRRRSAGPAESRELRVGTSGPSRNQCYSARHSLLG